MGGKESRWSGGKSESEMRRGACVVCRNKGGSNAAPEYGAGEKFPKKSNRACMVRYRLGTQGLCAVAMLGVFR